MNVKKNIVILGGRESGVGAAILATKNGIDVFLSDNGIIEDKFKKDLIKYKIKFEEKKHTTKKILQADEIIRSPGISDKTDVMKKIHTSKIPVISDIEFSSRFTDASLIGITGSNGKTTTTLWTHHLLKKAGINVGLAGNVGNSFAKEISLKKHDTYVLELSSFQLDDMYKFRANIAVLLNITPDHLDRYNYNFYNYVRSKFRIIRNQKESDYFIYNADDKVIEKHLKNYKNLKMNLIPFSIHKELERGAYIKNGKIIIQLNHKPEIIMPLESLALQGKHNWYNALAAGIIGKILLLKNQVIREALIDFANIEHRLEFVAKVHGIEFTNDSKATNVNSVWYALESMNTPIVWIAGGVDKGNDYSMLTELVSKKVKAIVCLGVDNMRIHDAFSKHVNLIVNTQSMEDAVKMAYHLSDKGDTVLLSPACASFDLFENFEDRGRKFKTLVRNL